MKILAKLFDVSLAGAIWKILAWVNFLLPELSCDYSFMMTDKMTRSLSLSVEIALLSANHNQVIVSVIIKERSLQKSLFTERTSYHARYELTSSIQRTCGSLGVTFYGKLTSTSGKKSGQRQRQ